MGTNEPHPCEHGCERVSEPESTVEPRQCGARRFLMRLQ